MGTQNKKGNNALANKMSDLEAAYRQISERDQYLIKNRRIDERDEERERDVNKLEEKLKIARTDAENAKRELKNELEGRRIVDRKLKTSEKDNKELRNKLSSLRVKLGVANANYNVGRHETEELRKNHQENQIQIARLEERLIAANTEREKLKHPDNPDGSEEVQRRLDSDKKVSKKLKTKIERLENLREEDLQVIERKEEENRMMAGEIHRCRLEIANLQNALEMAELSIQNERANREKFERQNIALRQDKANFDAQIHQFKVKLGISQATKNVNVRQAVELRRKEDEHQQAVLKLEQKLKKANAEIERLNTRNAMTGKTANSMQEHKGRVSKLKHKFGPAFLTPRGTEGTEIISGWSPNRTSSRVEKDGLSLKSVE
ncbi:tropomyosin beta chain-like, partial [Ruditapes philippinarum]|uniref:tropomyosin beta chain-like n=1 Tax=Ruditapes philippinarum TaxID=129788 RepID=UPI00295AF197